MDMKTYYQNSQTSVFTGFSSTGILMETACVTLL